MHSLIRYKGRRTFRQRRAPRQLYLARVNRQMQQRQSQRHSHKSPRIRHRRHKKSRQRHRAREINRSVLCISRRAPAPFLLHLRICLKHEIRQQMPQQQRQHRSRQHFHLIPPLARFDTNFPTCTFSYKLPPPLLHQQPHPLHRLFHLPKISPLQIPRHRGHIQPHRFRRRLQPSFLPEDRDRFPLLLRNLQQQRILQSINQIRRGIEHGILRLEPRQNLEFISLASLHSFQRRACELKCLAPQPVHRTSQAPRHAPDSDSHPQPQRPHPLAQIENQFRQPRIRSHDRLKLIPCRDRIRQPYIPPSQMGARRQLQPLSQQRPQIPPRPGSHHIRNQHRISSFRHLSHLVRFRTILQTCTFSYKLKNPAIFLVPTAPLHSSLHPSCALSLHHHPRPAATASSTPPPAQQSRSNSSHPTSCPHRVVAVEFVAARPGYSNRAPFAAAFSPPTPTLSIACAEHFFAVGFLCALFASAVILRRCPSSSATLSVPNPNSPFATNTPAPPTPPSLAPMQDTHYQ